MNYLEKVRQEILDKIAEFEREATITKITLAEYDQTLAQVADETDVDKLIMQSIPLGEEWRAYVAEHGKENEEVARTIGRCFAYTAKAGELVDPDHEHLDELDLITQELHAERRKQVKADLSDEITPQTVTRDAFARMIREWPDDVILKIAGEIAQGNEVMAGVGGKESPLTTVSPADTRAVVTAEVERRGLLVLTPTSTYQA